MRIFCYCCKQHIDCPNDKPFEFFSKFGHVNDRATAKQRYGIGNISRLPKDSELGRRK